jgi:hypothetical protein
MGRTRDSAGFQLTRAPKSVVLAAALLVALFRWSAVARAQVRPPAMAEPLIGESVTDIDGDEPGETEVDLGGVLFRGRDGLTWGGASAELELRLTRRLGVFLELGFQGAHDHGLRGGINAGGSLALWHDFRRDLHLQFEVRALVFDSEFMAARLRSIPDEEAPPYAFGLRGAYRRRWLTFRFGLGPSIAGRDGSVPLWADAALFVEWGARRGFISFAGIEVVTDWASATPVIISPEIVLGHAIADLPMRVGVGLPFFLATRGSEPFVGGFLRVILELDRD